jgi:hypothetical protein
VICAPPGRCGTGAPPPWRRARGALAALDRDAKLLPRAQSSRLLGQSGNETFPSQRARAQLKDERSHLGQGPSGQLGQLGHGPGQRSVVIDTRFDPSAPETTNEAAFGLTFVVAPFHRRLRSSAFSPLFIIRECEELTEEVPGCR